VLTSPTDASFAVVCSTPPLWHLDAVGGVHPIAVAAKASAFVKGYRDAWRRVAATLFSVARLGLVDKGILKSAEG
jgi:hypothetical protein